MREDLDIERPVTWTEFQELVRENIRAQGRSLTINFETIPDPTSLFKSPKLRSILICWGVPHGPLPKKIARLIRQYLANIAAPAIVCNDPLTADFCRRFGGGARVIVQPHFVDERFFSPADSKHVNHFDVLVPGDGSRNELVLRTLVASGYKVARISRHDIVPSHRVSGVSYFNRLPFNDYRSLIHSSATVLLPTKEEHHMAGQTALLEAVASGKSVITDNRRLAWAYRRYRGVHYAKNITSEAIERSQRDNNGPSPKGLSPKPLNLLASSWADSVIAALERR